MQLQLQNVFNLSEYTEKVKLGNWNFPDFSDECPICGSKHCAVRIGYYYRWVYIFNLKIKILIPIARYLCRRKNTSLKKLKSKHKTFSLLPSQIIPYRLYDLDTLLFIAVLRFKNGQSLLNINAEFSAISDTAALAVATVLEYILLFIAAHTKLFSYPEYKFKDYADTVILLEKYQGGITSFAQFIHKGYTIFLFGTPSQCR